MAVSLQNKNQTPQLPKQGRESYLISMSKDTWGHKTKSWILQLSKITKLSSPQEQNTACVLHAVFSTTISANLILNLLSDVSSWVKYLVKYLRTFQTPVWRKEVLGALSYFQVFFFKAYKIIKTKQNKKQTNQPKKPPTTPPKTKQKTPKIQTYNNNKAKQKKTQNTNLQQ